jgi:hypothetical protein
MCMTCFWNNLHQERSKSKYWRAKHSQTCTCMSSKHMSVTLVATLVDKQLLFLPHRQMLELSTQINWSPTLYSLPPTAHVSIKYDKIWEIRAITRVRAMDVYRILQYYFSYRSVCRDAIGLRIYLSGWIMHFYTSKLNKTRLNFQSFYYGYFYQTFIVN